MGIFGGSQIFCESCGEKHGIKENCRVKPKPEPVVTKQEAETIKNEVSKDIEEEKKIKKQSIEKKRQLREEPIEEIEEEIEELEEEIEEKPKPKPKRKIEEEPEVSYDFVKKVQFSDENKNQFWIYKCRHCNSTLLEVPLSVLAFIHSIESERENNV